MKDCCKNGQENEPNKFGFKKWFNYVVYAIIAAIVIGALVSQISNN
ncbi:hypothetical protein [Yeosuana sp.]